MAKIASYPHVAISKYAVPRPEVVEAVPTAPVMFVPFVGDRGPANELKMVYSLGEFVNTYGYNIFQYNSSDYQEFLNISNWMSNGGAVLALRMEADYAPRYQNKSKCRFPYSNKVDTDYSEWTFKAKYSGDFYKNVAFSISSLGTRPSLSIEVTNGGTTVKEVYEKFIVNASNYDYILDSSEYIDFKNAESEDGKFYDLLKVMLDYIETNNSSISNLGTGLDELYTDASSDPELYNLVTSSTNFNKEYRENLLKLFFYIDDEKAEYTDPAAFIVTELLQARELLTSKIEFPVDVFFDAKYPENIKRGILRFASERSDIHFFMDCEEMDDEVQLVSSTIVESVETLVGRVKNNFIEKEIDMTNISFYAQNMKILNPYNTDDEITVSPTYFLSSLVIENLNKYGLQYPVAGLTRGTITGVRHISFYPTAKDKETLYTGKVNYIERDARGYKFMCQLTQSEENTALSYVNNSRVTNKIANDIELMGRQYLFEFNDSTTITNMKNELNSYLSNWVQKRVLSTFNLEVETTDHNRVDIQLGIQFVGTIEIIAVSITIE